MCNIIRQRIWILIFCLSSTCFAQNNYDIAAAYFDIEEYANAKEYVSRSVVRNSKNSSSYKLLAQCCLKLKQYEEALEAYEKLLKLVPNDKDGLFGYATSLKCTGIYQQASEMYKKLYAADTTNREIRKEIKACEQAMIWLDNPRTISVKNIKKINSRASEVAPMWFGEGLVFSSSREGTIIKRKSGGTGQNFFNLYYANKKGKGWGKLRYFSPELNSPNHDGAACFSANQKEIYFTRIEYTNRENMYSSSVNRLKLYRSKKQLVGWSSPEYFILNDSTYSYGHPFMNKTESVFFFASDMSGGYGGTDLYMCLRVNDTSWTKPINLGPEVNSDKDELYPFFDDEHHLYFSSNGHLGMGGYDLFSAVLYDGKWSERENLKSPINSSYDEYSIILKDKLAVFSSNRKGGVGSEDLYWFQYLEN